MNDLEAPTLSSLIVRAAPDTPAIISASEQVTYGQLSSRAAAYARGLEDRGISRFACLLDAGADLVALLAGASAVGVEACVYPVAGDDAMVADLAQAFDHDTIITDRALDVATRTLDPEDLSGVGEPSGWPDRHGPAPVLILTTGTTGRPKGARHDWRRLVAGASRWVSPANARWLVAYNLNQFAGYQVILHALISGASLVFPSGARPREALRAMADHGVTHASATPTFWRFLLGLLGDSEPPGLRQITLGGESVPADLLAELRRRFPEARVSQVYASTEAGTGASASDEANGLPLSVLDRGDDADVQMKIVDGELYVRSKIGMLGYYGSVDDTDDWRPTGDQVEVRGDRIHFVGRTVEIINVGGVKVHPLTIEERVIAVPGVRFAHARARANPVTGQIVQLDVVPEDAVEDIEELEDAIREACNDLPSAAQPRRIRYVDQIDTMENKVRRVAPEDPT